MHQLEKWAMILPIKFLCIEFSYEIQWKKRCSILCCMFTFSKEHWGVHQGMAIGATSKDMHGIVLYQKFILMCQKQCSGIFENFEEKKRVWRSIYQKLMQIRYTSKQKCIDFCSENDFFRWKTKFISSRQGWQQRHFFTAFKFSSRNRKELCEHISNVGKERGDVGRERERIEII